MTLARFLRGTGFNPFIFLICTVFLCGVSDVRAEGSRTLYPSTYPSACGAAPGQGCRSNLDLQPAEKYVGKVLRRTFLYVYAQQGEYILLGSRNRDAGGDIRVYDPAVFGVPGDETVPASPSFSCASATAPAGSFSGGGRGLIASRTAELAGPNSADNSQTVAGGYAPCAYQAPVTGIYGVIFTAASTGGAPNGSVATPAHSSNSVSAWDVTVRSDATSLTDLNGRLFTYAWIGFTGGNNRPDYSVHYYVTSDGYRYAQNLRGLDPNGYALYANSAGFLDNGQPLYKDIRGREESVTSLPAGVTTQIAQYPSFFSDITPGGPNETELARVLAALGIPTAPIEPNLFNVRFSGHLSGSVTTQGTGGVFQFDTVNAQSYEIVVSRDGIDFDPANPANRVLTGTTGTGSQSVDWDGKDNRGAVFPAQATPFLYRVRGHNGEIHLPIIDAENNPGRGPTITRLNGSGSPNTQVYYDDRGYRTAGGQLVGILNGFLCGASLPGGPSVQVSLTGVDSTSGYRDWVSGRNANSDCARDAGWGDTKGLNLWSSFATPDVLGSLGIQDAPVDVATSVTAPASVAAGTQVQGTFSFANNGSSPAQGITYSMSLNPGLGAVSFTNLPAGASASYDDSTGIVTLSGLPVTLAANQSIPFIGFSYTAPASGTVTVSTSIDTTSQDSFADNNTASASTGIGDSDVLTTVTVPDSVSAGATVSGGFSFANHGGSSASGVSYTAIIGSPGSFPAAVDFTSLPSGVTASYDSSNGQVSFQGMPATLVSGQAFNFGFEYVAPASGSVSVSTSIATTSPESSTANNTASGSTDITPGSDMSVSISGLPTATSPGASVTGTLVCNNAGSGAAQDATCAVSTGTLSGCFQTPGDIAVGVPVSVASLPAGASIRCTLTLTAPTSGVLAVSGSTGASNDRNPANNAVTVPPIPVIDAVDDGPVSLPVGGGVVGVLGNDTLGGVPVVFGSPDANISAPTLISNGGLNGLSVDSAGRIVVPSGNPDGRYTVTYQICSSPPAAPPACDSAQAMIQLGGAGTGNRPPLANNDAAGTLRNVPVAIPAASNDAAGPGALLNPGSIDLNPLVAGRQTSFTVPGQGTFSIDSGATDGIVRFTPAADFVGTVSAAYTIGDNLGQVSNPARLTVTVTEPAAPNLPVANDDSVTTPQGVPATVPASQNDVAGPGQVLIPGSLRLIDPADGQPKSQVTTAEGVWRANDPVAGTVLFAPAAGFTGVAVIDYVIRDGRGATSEPASIKATVTGAASSVLAVDDSGVTRATTPISLSVLNNDHPSAGSSLVPGSVDLDPATPDSRESTRNTPEGAWSVDDNGLVRFVPTSDYQGTGQPFTGTATLPYTVRDSDGRVSNPATVTVVVSPAAVNAVNDNVVTPENTPVTMRPAANDLAAPGAVINPATVDLDPSTTDVIDRGPITTPEGTWEVIDDAGTVRFTPAPGYSGSATLTYRVSDSLGNTGTAVITVIVAPAEALPGLPDAVDQNVTTPQNTPVSGNVTTGGTVPEGSSVGLNSKPTHGSVSLGPDGSFTYVPDSNYSGTDSFTYTICLAPPNQAICDTATVNITVGDGKAEQRPVNLTLKSGRKSVRCGRAVALVVRGGSGKGALKFSVSSEGTVNCRIVKSRGKPYLKASGTPPGSCSVTVTKKADKTHAAATSNTITVKVK